MKAILTIILSLAVSMATSLAGPAQATFTEIPLQAGSFDNGSAGASGFFSGGIFFSNSFQSTEFGDSWSGFAISNVVDTTTPGFGNQYAAFPGGGFGEDGEAVPGNKYAVAFNFDQGTATVTLPADATFPVAVAIANSTYAALSMRDGDAFAKQFGGETGDDPDFFILTIVGIDAEGAETGSVEVPLADYRFEDNAQDFILSQWRDVDLTPLGPEVRQLQFALESSDVGEFGMNTPAYFCLDALYALEYVWAGAPDVGLGFVDVPWYRPVNVEFYPWTFLPTIGWCYAFADTLTEDGVWLYNPTIGWFYTSPDAWPVVYRLADDTLYTHVENAPQQATFVNNSTGEEVVFDQN